MILFPGNVFLFSACCMPETSRFRCMTVDVVSQSTERFTKPIGIHEIVRYITKEDYIKSRSKTR